MTCDPNDSFNTKSLGYLPALTSTVIPLSPICSTLTEKMARSTQSRWFFPKIHHVWMPSLKKIKRFKVQQITGKYIFYRKPSYLFTLTCTNPTFKIGRTTSSLNFLDMVILSAASKSSKKKIKKIKVLAKSLKDNKQISTLIIHILEYSLDFFYRTLLYM